MTDVGNFPIKNYLQPVIDVKVARPDGTDFIDVRALIDTGAMRSAVSKKYVRQLKLLPCGTTSVSSPFSKAKSGMLFKARIRFPFNYEFLEVPVITIKDSDERAFDVVIGMDVLSAGDLLLTNANGELMLSLRFPADNNRIEF